MIAALPMYDMPSTRAAHDRLWTCIRAELAAEGIAAPPTLCRVLSPWEGWTHPGLVLGQICGLPLRSLLADRLTVIGAFDYALPDTPPGHYHSLFVSRRGAPRALDSYRNAILAYNEALSHSGWAAAQLAAARAGFRFTRHVETGGHLQSVQAVAAGRGDIAAVDAISWRTIRVVEPAAGALQVIGRTASAPGQALVTRAGRDPAPFARALVRAVEALPDATRRVLGIAGFVPLGKADWLAVPTPPGPEATRPLHRGPGCALLPGRETATSGAVPP